MLDFDAILEKRRSMRVYDSNATIDDNIIKKAIERATLSPNSSNMQTWEFYWVKTAEKRQALAHACLNQSAARTAPHLVVFVTRQDKWKTRAQWHLDFLKEKLVGEPLTKKNKRALEYYSKIMPLLYRNDLLGINTLWRTLIMLYIGLRKPIMRITTHADQRIVCHKSCALAAQTFMMSLAADGYDSCPMEGFDERIVRKILKLPTAAEITMIVACGIGTEEGIYDQRRRLPLSEVIFEI